MATVAASAEVAEVAAMAEVAEVAAMAEVNLIVEKGQEVHNMRETCDGPASAEGAWRLNLNDWF